MKMGHILTTIENIKTGENKNIILSCEPIINESLNILEIIAKLNLTLTKKGINPLEWSILKLEKIEEKADDYSALEKKYATEALMKSRKILESKSKIINNTENRIDTSNVKKYIIENLTDEYKLIKIEYENNKIVLTVYDKENTYI